MLCSHLPDSIVDQNSEAVQVMLERRTEQILLDLEVYSGLLTAAALNLILNSLSFVERHQSGTFDGANVYEHIFAAALRLNESITLGWIEPLHSAGSHGVLPVESNHNKVVGSMGNSKMFCYTD